MSSQLLGLAPPAVCAGDELGLTVGVGVVDVVGVMTRGVWGAEADEDTVGDGCNGDGDTEGELGDEKDADGSGA
jgi:hypothetical protein